MNQKKLVDTLSIFQEAVIEEMKRDGEDLNFKIECIYLAELIHPSYKYFYGTLKGVKDIFFQTWDDEDLLITSAEEIQNLRPDILSIDIDENDYIKIYSNCSNTYTGGNICINAKDIKIYDEDFQEMNLAELSTLAEKYWYSGNHAEG